MNKKWLLILVPGGLPIIVTYEIYKWIKKRKSVNRDYIKELHQKINKKR